MPIEFQRKSRSSPYGHRLPKQFPVKYIRAPKYNLWQELYCGFLAYGHAGIAVYIIRTRTQPGREAPARDVPAFQAMVLKRCSVKFVSSLTRTRLYKYILYAVVLSFSSFLDAMPSQHRRYMLGFRICSGYILYIYTPRMVCFPRLMQFDRKPRVFLLTDADLLLLGKIIPLLPVSAHSQPTYNEQACRTGTILNIFQYLFICKGSVESKDHE